MSQYLYTLNNTICHTLITIYTRLFYKKPVYKKRTCRILKIKKLKKLINFYYATTISKMRNKILNYPIQSKKIEIIFLCMRSLQWRPLKFQTFHLEHLNIHFCFDNRQCDQNKIKYRFIRKIKKHLELKTWYIRLYK